MRLIRMPGRFTDVKRQQPESVIPMAAFDRVCSGLPGLDSALDFIRLGDNVVWRVSDLQEFHLFLDPFVERTIADGRKLVYVRFASHPPLISERRV